MRTFIAALVILGSVAGAETIVHNGKSAYVIVISSSPLPANVRAANELQNHLKQMSGAELPIRNDGEPLPERAILIGPSRHLNLLLDAKKLGNDGFTLKTTDHYIKIAGPGPRGSMYGVSDLLEKLGVRWLTPTVTIVPKKESIELPELNETQVPAFEYREPYFTEAWDKDWAARNRVIGHSPRLDASTGGGIRYAEFVHSIDRLVPRELYRTHPEYFPLVNGKRLDGYVQRCLSNPDVLKVTVANVKEKFKADPTAMICSVSQNDTGEWCQCENCKAIVAKYGGVQSGIWVWFVNQVAEMVEKSYPDKLIDTLAYQFTETPPKNIAPRKNVRVRLCPIAACQFHPFESDDFKASKDFVANLANWHALAGDTLYIWDYCTNFPNYLMPLPDFNEFPANVRLYARSGVRGVFFEGSYAGPGGSDAELRSYLMAKILWNPAVDSDALVTEWMKGVYGKAWQPMREWFDLLHARAKEPQFHPFCYTPFFDKLYSPETLVQGDKCFDEAQKLAAGDESAGKYVAKNRLWLRYCKIVKKIGNEDLDRFVADCKTFGITHSSESGTLDDWAKGLKEKK